MNYLAVENESEFANQVQNLLMKEFPGHDVLYMAQVKVSAEGSFERTIFVDVPKIGVHIEAENLNETIIKVKQIAKCRHLQPVLRVATLSPAVPDRKNISQAPVN